MDPLTTRPIRTGWEFTMEPYPSWQFVFIGDPDRQFGNGSVWTRTWTRSDGPEPLLMLSTWRVPHRHAVIARLAKKATNFLHDSGPKPFSHFSILWIHCMHTFLVDLKLSIFNLIIKPFLFYYFQLQARFLQNAKHNPHVILIFLSCQFMD